jgi:protoheme IX farnesyltransferase
VDQLRTYYLLAKPGIIRGNLLTASAGFVVASGRHIDLLLLVETLAGIGLVIASACVINNYLDRGIDKVMARTRQRALVTGAISPRRALIMAAVLGLAGFTILAVHTNWLTVAVGLVGFVDYVVLYGLSKRRSWTGTLVGSISGAAPVVGGYTAVAGRFDAGALILFLILTCWQMPHFYAIALRRLDDYRAADIPVLPAVRGTKATKTQVVTYMAGFLAAVVALWLAGYSGVFYAVTMGALGIGWLVIGLSGWQAQDTKRWATRVFLYSLILLPAFLVAVLVDVLLAG